MDVQARAEDYRPVRFGSRDVTVEHRPDGTILVRPVEPLGPYPRLLTDALAGGASRHPDRVFIAERAEGGGWRTLSWSAALQAARRVGQALLDRGLSPDRPIAIISPASTEHAILALAALYAGIPYAAVTPAYALLSGDGARLRQVLDGLAPGLVFAQSGEAYARALALAIPRSCETVVADGADPARGDTSFAALLATTATAAVDDANRRIDPDALAKIVLTSGSTGSPKKVITTNRMLSSNQQMFVQSLPAMLDEPPVLLSWLPWHHVSGGSQLLGLSLYCGGSLYLDRGKPTRDEIGETVRNLKEIAPTAYFTVPRGFSELIPHLRADPALRSLFFSRVKFFYYSGAAITDDVIRDLDALALSSCGKRIALISGYGATEVAAFALCANWTSSRSGLAGLPAPGNELKLVPVGDKLEARLRGPNMTPGYWRDPSATARAFDDEGYYATGDALRPLRAGALSEGLLFDGRLAEDFKLATGTWVNVAMLRERLVMAGHPHLLDAVIVGENRDGVGALVFLRDEAWTELAAGGAEDWLRALLSRLAADATGSSTFIGRAMLMTTAPRAEDGEVADKGSISAKGVIKARAALVEALYQHESPGIVALRPSPGA